MSSGERYWKARSSMLPSGTWNSWSPTLILTSFSNGRNKGPGLDMVQILSKKAAAGKNRQPLSSLLLVMKQEPPLQGISCVATALGGDPRALLTAKTPEEGKSCGRFEAISALP